MPPRSRAAAKAVARVARRQIGVNVRHVELAVVRSSDPLSAELVDGSLTLSDDILILGSSARRYARDFGIDPGDTLALVRLSSDDYLVLDVQSPNELTNIAPDLVEVNAHGGDAPAFSSGWSQLSAHRQTGCLKTQEGMVTVVVEANSAAAGTIFTLPDGYRPAATVSWVARGDDGSGTSAVFGRITAAGDVIADTVRGGSSPTLAFSITFPSW